MISIHWIKNMKMRSKLLLTYLLVVLLPVVFIGYFLITRTVEVVLQRTDSINLMNSQQIMLNIQNKMNGYLSISDNIITDRQLINDLEAYYPDYSDYLGRYADYISFYSSKSIIYNPDNIGISIYTSNKSVIPDYKLIKSADDTIKKEKWYRDILKANGANIIGKTYTNEAGKAVFTIGRVLDFTTNEKSLNVLVLEIPETHIYSMMSREKSFKDIYLIDRDGYILSSTDRNALGGLSADIPGLKQVLEQEDPLSSDGNTVLLGFDDARMPVKGWKLICIVSSDVFLASIREIVQYSIFICFISAVIAIIIIIFFSNRISSRLRVLVDNMVNIRNEQFDVFVNDDAEDEIGKLSKSFKDMMGRINGLITEVYVANMNVKDLQIKKKEAELNALQSQINPHFLFNTMHSIQMNLISRGDSETSDVIQNFAELLRKSITWGTDLITLESEIELVDSYLKIQKFRYPKKLDYSVDVHPTLYKVMIPKFTLQPVVENAIYHGIERKEAKGCLKLYSFMTGSSVKVTIEDDGVGIDDRQLTKIRNELDGCMEQVDDRKPRTSIGLINVHQRLKIYYGAQYGITVSSKKGYGTRVEILIPLQPELGGIYDVQCTDS